MCLMNKWQGSRRKKSIQTMVQEMKVRQKRFVKKRTNVVTGVRKKMNKGKHVCCFGALCKSFLVYWVYKQCTLILGGVQLMYTYPGIHSYLVTTNNSPLFCFTFTQLEIIN